MTENEFLHQATLQNTQGITELNKLVYENCATLKILTQNTAQLTELMKSNEEHKAKLFHIDENQGHNTLTLREVEKRLSKIEFTLSSSRSERKGRLDLFKGFNFYGKTIINFIVWFGASMIALGVSNQWKSSDQSHADVKAIKAMITKKEDKNDSQV